MATAQFAGSAPKLRLLTFGTSLTADQRWPFDLAQHLAHCTGRALEARSIAMPGGDSGWGSAHAAQAAATLPDLAVIEFAVNDADLRHGVTLTASSENIRKIVAEIRRRHSRAHILLLATPQVTGFRHWLLRPRLDRYFDQLRDIARTQNVSFVDARPGWQSGLASKRILPAADGLHPDRASLSATLVPLLASASGLCSR